jgi:hypothetical protein
MRGEVFRGELWLLQQALTPMGKRRDEHTILMAYLHGQ